MTAPSISLRLKQRVTIRHGPGWLRGPEVTAPSISLRLALNSAVDGSHTPLQFVALVVVVAVVVDIVVDLVVGIVVVAAVVNICPLFVFCLFLSTVVSPAGHRFSAAAGDRRSAKSELKLNRGCVTRGFHDVDSDAMRCVHCRRRPFGGGFLAPLSWATTCVRSGRFFLPMRFFERRIQ